MTNQNEITLRALRKCGNDVIPALVDALSDPDEEVREVVMRLIWELDIKDESILPVMIGALEDSNKSIRHSVAWFVTRFGERAKAAVPTLQSWIASNDETSSILAAGSILMIDKSQADAMLSLLIDALGSDGIEQLEAIGQIEGLGELAQDAVPALKQLLDEHSTVSLFACDAIYAISGDPTDSITVGIELLYHDEWLDRYVGAEHLGLLGAMARSAIPRLKWTVQNDADEMVRNRARQALREIEEST